jgi:hypothetical protein
VAGVFIERMRQNALQCLDRAEVAEFRVAYRELGEVVAQHVLGIGFERQISLWRFPIKREQLLE